MRLEHAVRQAGVHSLLVIDAAECVLDELSAVEQQVGPELAACCREVVEGVQIEVLGYRRDDSVMVQPKIERLRCIVPTDSKPKLRQRIPR